MKDEVKIDGIAYVPKRQYEMSLGDNIREVKQKLESVIGAYAAQCIKNFQDCYEIDIDSIDIKIDVTNIKSWGHTGLGWHPNHYTNVKANIKV